MMSSIISQRFCSSSRSAIRLNALQKRLKAQVERKIENGDYVFEEVLCVCGGAYFDIIAERDRFGFKVRNVICRDCGLLRLNPRFTPETYARFYNDEYRMLYTGRETVLHQEHVFAAQIQTGERISQFVADVMGRRGNPAYWNAPRRVLEVGCSSGGILAFFKTRGHRVVGVDYDSAYAAFGRKKAQLDLKTGGIEAVSETEVPFDVIILSHTFEHIASPLDFLQKARRLLLKDGVMFICVPGLKRMSYYTHPPFDVLYYLQNAHPFTYSLTTLTQVFKMAGFELLEGTEEVFALFQPGAGAGVSVAMPNNDYQPAVDFLKSVERRRFWYRARYYFWVRMCQRIGNFLKRKIQKGDAGV